MQKDDVKKQFKALYQPKADAFSLVDVPEMPFAMIDGEGRPKSATFAAAVTWLYSTVYPLKWIARERVGKDFIVAPLEGLWWADDWNDFVADNRDRWKWRLMIALPGWMTWEMFEQGRAKAGKKLGQPPAGLRMERFQEGRCVQILHIGPYSEEAPTIARMHTEFMPQNGLAPRGYHHEIYLSDERKVAPEKLKTVLRQPVQPAEG